MSRSVEEWCGKTDDTPVPNRVRVRVFDAKNGRCHACGRRVGTGERWTCEHLVAIINGGENRERNLDVTCCNCLSGKNATDAALKSDTYDMRRKHVLERRPKGRPMPGTKLSGWKRRMDGTVERR